MVYSSIALLWICTKFIVVQGILSVKKHRAGFPIDPAIKEFFKNKHPVTALLCDALVSKGLYLVGYNPLQNKKGGSYEKIVFDVV